MSSLRLVFVLVVVLAYGAGITKACNIVDVSRCYAPLLSKVDVGGYCRALPETKYCIRRLMSSRECRAYVVEALQTVMVHLQDFSESPRCRRYIRRNAFIRTPL